MPDIPDDLLETLRRRWETLTSSATTRARSPRATIEPPTPDTDEGARAALTAFEAIGDSLRAGTSRLALERTLGEGGMGVVRLATQVVLGRKVAVKTLKNEARSRTATLDLLREAWITGSLEHPNVVPVYDVGMDEQGGPLVVLKRIEGAHWGEVMHDRAAIAARFGATDPLEWNLRILVSVSNALAFAHSRGIVHRDLKPENVMVGSFGEVYLLDWGIAVTTREDDTRLPRACDAHEMAGTPCYMAPEMLGGQAHRIGPASDVYLLGAVLHEIVTGAPPHDGPSVEAMFASVLLSPPELPDAVPVEAAHICRRAMAREPEDRFPSAEAFRHAIEAFLEHRGSMQLAEQSDGRFALLRCAIAEEAPEDEIYDLLGESRFGYRAALASWDGNAQARAGLAATLTAMAEYELSRGEPHAAARLLRELPERPAELAARVASAERAKDEEQHKLEALGKQLDPGPGSRTRVFATALMGILWIGIPLQAYLRGIVPSHRDSVAVTGGLLVVFLAFVTWARESLQKTLVNQRLAGSVLFVMGAQAMIELAASSAGLPSRSTWPLYAVLWSAMLGSVSLWFEPRFWPSTVLGVGLTVFTIELPDHALLGFSVFNLVLVVNTVWAWLPRGDLARAESRLREHIDERRRALRASRDRLR